MSSPTLASLSVPGDAPNEINVAMSAPEFSVDPGTPVEEQEENLFGGFAAAEGVAQIRRTYSLPPEEPSAVRRLKPRFDLGKTPRSTRPVLKTGSNFKDGRVQVQHSSNKVRFPISRPATVQSRDTTDGRVGRWSGCCRSIRSSSIGTAA